MSWVWTEITCKVCGKKQKCTEDSLCAGSRRCGSHVSGASFRRRYWVGAVDWSVYIPGELSIQNAEGGVYT